MALSVQTVSASVDITVPRGVRPRGTQRSRSGSVRVDCPPGGDAVIDVVTQSGSIRIAER